MSARSPSPPEVLVSHRRSRYAFEIDLSSVLLRGHGVSDLHSYLFLSIPFLLITISFGREHPHMPSSRHPRGRANPTVQAAPWRNHKRRRLRRPECRCKNGETPAKPAENFGIRSSNRPDYAASPIHSAVPRGQNTASGRGLLSVQVGIFGVRQVIFCLLRRIFAVFYRRLTGIW